jgi:HK97 family phage portal protein
MAVLATRSGNVPVDPIGRGYTASNYTTWGGGYVPLASATRKYATYGGLYKLNPFLHAAVNKIARGTARLPLKGFRRVSGGDRENLKDEGHPLANLLEFPNPQMSASRFKEWLFSDLALNGNAAAVMLQDPNGTPNAPVELWPVLWPKVEVEGRYFPEVYHVHTPLGRISFQASKVLHIRFAESDPDNPLVGISPVEPLAQAVANDDAAAKWSTAMFKNAGRPSGMFVTEKNLNNDQTTALRQQAQQIYGGVENAFRIGALGGGLQWQPMSMSTVETGLIDLRKLNREEVAAVYDIPPPMLQDLTHATFSNVTEQHRMFYTGTLPPWLTLFEEEFYSQIIARVPGWEELYVEFDMNEVLKGSPKERWETYALARRAVSINEVRAWENLPRIDKPEYDEVWEPINEAPVGQPLTNRGSLPAPQRSRRPYRRRSSMQSDAWNAPPHRRSVPVGTSSSPANASPSSSPRRSGTPSGSLSSPMRSGTYWKPRRPRKMSAAVSS